MPRVFQKYKDEYKDEARKRIIESALVVVKKKGYRAMTIDDVAKEVGVTKGTLYLYFKNKDDLFNNVLAEGVNLFQKTMRYQRSESNDLDAVLGSMFDQLLQLQMMYGTIDDSIGFLGELISIVARDPDKKLIFFDLLKGNIQTFEDEFRILQEKKIIPEGIDLHGTVMGVIALLGGVKLRVFLGEDMVEIKEWWISSVKKLLDVPLTG